MKSRSFSIFLLSSAILWSAQTCLAQTPAPATAPGQVAAAPAASQPKARGPEAVAQSDPNRVVATIDGKPVTAKQALDMLKPFPPEQRKQYEANLSNLIQQVYMRVQLADLAAKLNLDQQTPWKDQIALARENVLAQAYLTHLSDDASKGPVEDTKKYYDAHPDEFDQVKLSGIFISFAAPGTPAPPNGANTRSETQATDKANEVEKKLKDGGDFSALARTESDNQQSAQKGGDLGTYNMGEQSIPPVLRSAIAKLQPGQYSEPVKVNNAYLILKLDSRNKLSYAEVQNTLGQRLKSEKGQNVVKQELDKYKIKVEDQDFFEAASPRTIPTLQRPAAPAPPTPGTPK